MLIMELAHARISGNGMLLSQYVRQDKCDRHLVFSLTGCCSTTLRSDGQTTWSTLRSDFGLSTMSCFWLKGIMAWVVLIKAYQDESGRELDQLDKHQPQGGDRSQGYGRDRSCGWRRSRCDTLSCKWQQVVASCFERSDRLSEDRRIKPLRFSTRGCRSRQLQVDHTCSGVMVNSSRGR